MSQMWESHATVSELGYFMDKILSNEIARNIITCLFRGHMPLSEFQKSVSWPLWHHSWVTWQAQVSQLPRFSQTPLAIYGHLSPFLSGDNHLDHWSRLDHWSNSGIISEIISKVVSMVVSLIIYVWFPIQSPIQSLVNSAIIAMIAPVIASMIVSLIISIWSTVNSMTNSVVNSVFWTPTLPKPRILALVFGKPWPKIEGSYIHFVGCIYASYPQCKSNIF